MEKKVYYQAQFSEDGEIWRAYCTNHIYDVSDSFEEIKTIYDKMIAHHEKLYSSITNHRIVKYVVEMEVIE